MVKTRLWPPSGEQAVTETPTLSYDQAGKVVLSSETDGASIAYRVKGENGWQLFSPSTKLRADALYEAIAHRIGNKKSATVELRLDVPR